MAKIKWIKKEEIEAKKAEQERQKAELDINRTQKEGQYDKTITSITERR